MITRGLLAALLLMLAMAASAQATRLETVEGELRQLRKDVEELKAENSALKERARPIDMVTGRDQRSLSDTLEPRDSRLTPALTWRGDLRYRHEEITAAEFGETRKRERIRARLGVSAKVNDSVSGVLQIASNAGNNDPRSTTQTLTNGFSRKGVGIDLAHLDVELGTGWTMQLGKMPTPWKRTRSYLWDTNLTPEGVAMKYAGERVFMTAFGYSLNEFSAGADSTLIGTQIGIEADVRGMTLTGAVGYFDLGSIRGQVTAVPEGCNMPLNSTFFSGTQGNSTITVAGCPLLAHDFDIVQAFGQVGIRIGATPLTMFTDIVHNRAAGSSNLGYSVGFTIGKATDPHRWEVGYVYQHVESDAAFGQFVDIDFGGGQTDSRGSALRGGFMLSKNLLLSGTWLLNDRFVDAGPRSRYSRVQVEVTATF